MEGDSETAQGVHDSEQDAVDRAVQDRNAEYGDAWAITGWILSNGRTIRLLSSLLDDHPQMYFPWIMILNKLLRALVSPRNPDHWLDIAGYATLVHKDITK